MKKLLILTLFLAACSGENEAKPGNEAANSAPPVSSPKTKPSDGRIVNLAGLYEGRGNPAHQMCVTEETDGKAQFGLVVWGENLHSCSGSGTISRVADTVRLSMAGDSECVIEARISGRTITFPSEVDEGCRYYCGARARIGGAELDQVGGEPADARRAKDLVGEPLCD